MTIPCDFSWSKCKYADSYSLDIYSYDKKLINTVDIVNGNNYFINLPEGLYIATITAKNAVSNNVSISEEIYFEVITDSTTSTTTSISTTTTTTTQKSTTTTGIVKKCAVGEYPKSWIVRYQAA